MLSCATVWDTRTHSGLRTRRSHVLGGEVSVSMSQRSRAMWTGGRRAALATAGVGALVIGRPARALDANLMCGDLKEAKNGMMWCDSEVGDGDVPVQGAQVGRRLTPATPPRGVFSLSPRRRLTPRASPLKKRSARSTRAC